MSDSAVGTPLRVAIFDYGAGNLHSLAKAIAGPGLTLTIEADPVRAVEADALILPGVGAFGAATAAIGPHRERMRAAILDGLPTLGICLGMQLLFDESTEGGGRGLGVIGGGVTRLAAPRLPQIGWNAVENAGEPLLEAAALRIAYYANSFACRPVDPGVVTAWSTHGTDRFPAAVRAARAVGVQFHPEKSSAPGVRFVRAFINQIRDLPSGAAERRS